MKFKTYHNALIKLNDGSFKNNDENLLIISHIYFDSFLLSLNQ